MIKHVEIKISFDTEDGIEKLQKLEADIEKFCRSYTDKTDYIHVILQVHSEYEK